MMSATPSPGRPTYARSPPPGSDCPRHAAILTSNYGEAGAIDRYGPALGLPTAYSGHMGFWYWGPPPPSATSVLGVGFDPGYLERFLSRVRLLKRLDNHLQVSNDEQHAPIWLASGLRHNWSAPWLRFKASRMSDTVAKRDIRTPASLSVHDPDCRCRSPNRTVLLSVRGHQIAAICPQQVSGNSSSGWIAAAGGTAGRSPMSPV